MQVTVPGLKTPKTFQKKRQEQGPQWLKGYRSLRILGENPALVVVKQWRRPAAAAFCAGCTKRSSYLSRMLGGLCWDARRSAAAPAPRPPAWSARPGLSALALAPSVHRGERSGGSRRDALGGWRPLTSLGGPAGSGPEPGASPARRPAHGPLAPLPPAPRIAPRGGDA